MEKFVRKLFKASPDWRSLTPRVIREKFLTHTGQSDLDPEDKQTLKDIVLRVAAETNSNENEKREKTEPKKISSDEDKDSGGVHSGDDLSSDEDGPLQPTRKRKREASSLEDSGEDSSDMSSNEDDKKAKSDKVTKKRKLESSPSNKNAIKKKKGENQRKRPQRPKIEDDEDEDEDFEEGTLPSDDSDDEDFEVKPSTKKGPRSPAAKGKMKGQPPKRSQPDTDSEEEEEEEKSESDEEDEDVKEEKPKKGKSKMNVAISPRKGDEQQTSIKRKKGKVVIEDSDVSSDADSEENSPEELSSDDEAPIQPAGKRKHAANLDDSDITEEKPAHKDRKEKEARKKSLGRESDSGGDLSEDEFSSDDDMPLKPSEKKTVKDSDSSEVSASEDEVRKSGKNKTQKVRKKMKTDASTKSKTSPKKKKSDSSPGNKKSSEKNKKESGSMKQRSSADPTKNKHVLQLEKIARMCKALPIGKRYRETFEDCNTPNDRIRILKQLLADVGMTGTPSMEKAEEIKLKQEAAELDMANIIQSEGRGRRNVRSRFATHQEEPAPVHVQTPAKLKFSNLKGIIDSEESDSD